VRSSTMLIQNSVEFVRKMEHWKHHLQQTYGNRDEAKLDDAEAVIPELIQCMLYRDYECGERCQNMTLSDFAEKKKE